MLENDYFNLVINNIYNDIDYLQLGLQLAKEEFKSSRANYSSIEFLSVFSKHYNLFNSCIDNNLLNDIFSLSKFINSIKTKYEFNDILNNKTNRYRNVFLKIKNSLFYTYPEYVPLIGTYQEESLEKITQKDFLLFAYRKKLITDFLSINAHFPELNDYLLKDLYPIPTDFDITLPLAAYIYMIENDIYNYPRTLITGKYAKFDKDNKKFLIVDNKLQLKDPLIKSLLKEKRKETCIVKYGVEVSSQNEEVKRKMKNTCLDRFGVEHPSQNETIKQKMKNTCLDRFGVEHPSQNEEIKRKRKETFINKFGVENPMYNEDVKRKKKETCVEKYGVEYPSQNEEIKRKRKETFINKFGVENPMYNEDVKRKIKETCVEKYGVENPMNNDRVKEKNLETKRKNNSFNFSKPEEDIYKLLIYKFGKTNILREYKKDIRYPFACDFYITSLDMFIEYQGTWSHGRHPFDLNSEEDIKLLNKWKSKNFEEHPSYKNAINNWTVRDQLKRKTAKENNLNYIELWSLEEAIQFIDELPYLTSI